MSVTAQVIPSPFLLREYPEYDHNTHFWDVTIYTSSSVTMRFNLSPSDLDSNSVLTYGTYNGFNYLIRRTTKSHSCFRVQTENENKIFRMKVNGVVEADQTIETELYSYILMKPYGIRLIDFLWNWQSDHDIKKTILKRVLWTIKELHESGVVYNSDFYDNIFVNYGSDGDQLSVQLTNFSEAIIYSTLIPYKDKMNDFNNFGKLMITVLSDGQVDQWTDGIEFYTAPSPYYDGETVVHFLELINSFADAGFDFNDIITHPALWLDAKTIHFYNKLFTVTTLGTGALVINEDGFNFEGDWSQYLQPLLKAEVLEQQNRSLAIGKGKLMVKSVNVTTLQGLVACIRHSCDIHYLNLTERMQAIIHEPPKGIQIFSEAFPGLLTYLVDFVKQKFFDIKYKEERNNNEAIIYKAFNEFFVGVAVCNYGKIQLI